MRKDLNKLLCERERVGSSNKFHTVRHNNQFNKIDEQTPIRESMRKRYNVTHSWKSLNENLNPLLRFIEGSVGRNWDKVYKEICQSFDKRSVINQHILDHLFQYVATKVSMYNGELYHHTKWNGLEPLAKGWAPFYVDPKTNILKANKHRKNYNAIYRQRREQEKQQLLRVERVISEYEKLKCVDGIWYKIEYQPFPPPYNYTYVDQSGVEVTIVRQVRVYDVEKQEYTSAEKHNNDKNKNKNNLYAAKKYQLSKQDLKRYNVENTVGS